MKSTTLTLASFTLVIAAFALPVVAQDRAASAPMAGMSPGMQQDCGKSAMKRHDHGAERNTGTSAKANMDMPCSPATAASSADKSARKKPAHDHSRVHKTM